MTQPILDKRKLEELVKLSKLLDEQLKIFNNESEKMAQKWQDWAKSKRNKIQKQESSN